MKKPLKHHAKRLLRITPKFVHGMVLGAIAGVVVVSGLRATLAHAVSISSPRDCDTNSVINCGALTTAELQQRYSNKGVAAIYNYFGISSKDVGAMNKTAVAGLVYKSGKVTVRGVTVATNATTAGRENIAGSTRVTSGGVTFYKRHPSVSFNPNSIAAFVVMENGQFQFAILGACGNPVVATAVPKPKPKPTPTPAPTPSPTTPPPATPPPVETPPEIPPTETDIPETPDVPTTSTQTPESTPLPPPAIVTASAITELPNTGPGAVIIIAVLSVAGGYIFHATHRHIRRKRHLRRAATHHPR